MVKFTLEGVVSFAQMTSANIEFKVFYLQTNSWITLNATYFDQDSTQLTTTFVTTKNERGVYTNHIRFKLHNVAPTKAKNYELIKNEYMHIISVQMYANYMPFYCPTSLAKKGMFFQNQVANWQYIETYKLCNNEPDCIDASDEIFCDTKHLKDKNQKVSLGAMLKQNNQHGMQTNDAMPHCCPCSFCVVVVVIICSSIHCLQSVF